MNQIILNGFMASGKTTIGRYLAERLNLPFVDLDHSIEIEQGKSIASIFEDAGEAHFRALESRKLLQCLSQDGVLALGGGTLLNPQNLQAVLQTDCLLVNTRCDVNDIMKRVQNEDGTRPLLAGDPNGIPDKIRSLLQQRETVYNQYDIQINSSTTSPEEAANLIQAFLGIRQIRINHPGGYYPIWMGRNLLHRIGEMILARREVKRIAIVTNPIVCALYGHVVQKSLETTGIETVLIEIPDGEEGKTLQTVNHIYDALTAFKADRSSMLLALGGGITGDIGGFAAATYMRGIPLIQVPTTWLSMVDSSIGGKTGANLPQGKNLIGAFKQPEMVIMDFDVLATLPKDELLNGFGEFIKHGLIADADLVQQIMAAGKTVSELPDHPKFEQMVAQSLMVKANIVAKDPYEKKERMLINFGHTLAHAIEKASHYEIAHGEAVIMGMWFAAVLSNKVGDFSDEDLNQIDTIYNQYQLPRSMHELSKEELLRYMGLDKKKSTNEYRWILLHKIGEAYIENYSSLEKIASLLDEMGAGA